MPVPIAVPSDVCARARTHACVCAYVCACAYPHACAHACVTAMAVPVSTPLLVPVSVPVSLAVPVAVSELVRFQTVIRNSVSLPLLREVTLDLVNVRACVLACACVISRGHGHGLKIEQLICYFSIYSV